MLYNNMSIATAIQNAQTRVANAYTAVSGKGGTLPATQNLSNLPTAINSIPSWWGSFVWIPREIVSGVMQEIQSNHTYTLPAEVTDLWGYALYSGFYADKKLTSVDMNNLVTVSGVYALASAFQSASSLVSADFSKVTSVSNTQCMTSTFYSCSALTDVDFSSLVSITGANAMSTAFRACSSLTQLNFPSLVTIDASNGISSICRDCTSLVTFTIPELQTITGSGAMGNAFQGCSSLTNISFPKLKTIGTDNGGTNNSHLAGFLQSSPNITTLTFPELEKIYCNGGTTGTYGTFANNPYLQKLYFPKLDTIAYGTGASSANRHACKNTFYGCSALIELHFASANQSAIQASDGYSTAWWRWAGNVTIYFDL